MLKDFLDFAKFFKILQDFRHFNDFEIYKISMKDFVENLYHLLSEKSFADILWDS